MIYPHRQIDPDIEKTEEWVHLQIDGEKSIQKTRESDAGKTISLPIELDDVVFVLDVKEVEEKSLEHTPCLLPDLRMTCRNEEAIPDSSVSKRPDLTMTRKFFF